MKEKAATITRLLGAIACGSLVTLAFVLVNWDLVNVGLVIFFIVNLLVNVVTEPRASRLYMLVLVIALGIPFGIYLVYNLFYFDLARWTNPIGFRNSYGHFYGHFAVAFVVFTSFPRKLDKQILSLVLFVAAYELLEAISFPLYFSPLSPVWVWSVEDTVIDLLANAAGIATFYVVSNFMTTMAKEGDGRKSTPRAKHSFMSRTFVHGLVNIGVAMGILVAWGLVNEYIHVLFNAAQHTSTCFLLLNTFCVPPGALFNSIVLILASVMISSAVWLVFGPVIVSAVKNKIKQ